ncbi:response regulator [Luteimicrobium sp. DT211]|uniref:response regulator n=1 Tax=Luteimicrobium sp. DT211 TaxID=3393412 RepID=UPI003CF20135
MIGVLVVDDDFRVGEIHASFVASVDGMDVVGTARTGAEARALAEAHRPDLALVDNYLPDEGGVLVTAALSGLGVDVMMVTADDSAETVRAAVAAGALNYLIKPFPRADLVARLRAYARYRSRLAQGPVDQEQVDAALDALRSGDRRAPAKGQSAATARLVREALERCPDARSASEVADELGIARATAQRYLAALASDGHATMTLRYGVTGRPEHEYRWRG